MQIKDIKPGVEFSSASENNAIFRLVPENDSVLTLADDSEYPECDAYNEDFSLLDWPSYLEAGKIYYVLIRVAGNYTVQENNTEIKLGETVGPDQVGYSGKAVIFRPEKDVNVRCYASRDGEPRRASHDEAVHADVSTADDSPITVVDLNDNMFCDFDYCFKAKAGKTYILSQKVYFGDPVDCSVTPEECPPYVIEDGVLRGDLTGETEVNIPSHYNPPYDPENPDAYLDKDAEGAREVTEIVYTAYSFKGIVSVKVPDTVKKIGKGAFMGCEAMTEVTIPKSVTSIGEYAFGYSDEGDYDPEVYSWVAVKYDGFTIKGYKGTEAERYANDNGFTFIPLDGGEPNPTEYGDANGDGEVNISDATEIQRFIADYEKFNDAQLKFSDVNKDGVINVDDVTMIQKYLVGLVKTLG